jgi:hypothetical protein
MILYTLQEEFKFLEFQETGVLKAHPDIICADYFVDAYEWIEGKMKVLLPPSDIECKHPVWAWYKYNGKSKPDLRKSHFNKGDIFYCIKFEIDDSKVVLSDFENWHLVLGAKDEEEFKTKHTIFDIEESDDISSYIEQGFVIEDNKLKYDWNNIILDKKSDNKDIQATFWYITFDQVKSYTKHKSR